MIDFKAWYRTTFASGSPWGDEGPPALITTAETALEHPLSAIIMGGGKVRVRTVATGSTLVEQADPGRGLFVLLDGVLVVEVDGTQVAEVDPAALAELGAGHRREMSA